MARRRPRRLDLRSDAEADAPLGEQLRFLLPRDWPEGDLELLTALAEESPRAKVDFSPVLPMVREFLGYPGSRVFYAAGAALWRLTWRVNRTWLDGIRPDGYQLTDGGELCRLVTDVLIEHLGRRPDLAPLVAGLLGTLQSVEAQAVQPRVNRLADLGPAGWSVLLAVLRGHGPAALQKTIFRAAWGRDALLRLTQSHAHRLVSQRADNPNLVVPELVPPALKTLYVLGPDAASALPDLLRLALKEPGVGVQVGLTVSAVAPGYPMAAAALVRALTQLRGRISPRQAEVKETFSALAAALAELRPDAAPALVEDTGVEVGTVDVLLADGAWRNAPPDARLRHVRLLADALGSARPAVRERAARLLRHYAAELPQVWPALVAALTGPDDATPTALLAYFRVLGSVANEVERDLGELLRDPNATYAARALLALWRLGRLPELIAEIRASLLQEPTLLRSADTLQAGVLRFAADRGLTADPNAISARLLGLFDQAETDEDRKLAACLPPPGETGPADWAAVDALVGNDAIGPLLHFAVMAECGPVGLESKKIFLIKAIRGFTAFGLAEAKNAVERSQGLLARPIDVHMRREGIRGLFGDKPTAPQLVRDLLDHVAAPFRWAGLVLIDAWQPRSPEVEFVIEERTFDPSRRVREKALRLTHGV